jgi:hypothetical protein
MERRRLGAALASVCVVAGLVAAGACRPRFRSKGGGQIGAPPSMKTRAPGDVAVPDRYEIELIASGLTYPTGLTWDDGGELYVVEAGYATRKPSGRDKREPPGMAAETCNIMRRLMSH